MKKYIKVLTAASLTCMVTGALAQDPEEYQEQSSMPPPPPELQSAPAEGDATFFYETLQPHGTWVQVSPFGPAWRPHVAIKDTSWRPYYDGGRWVWSRNAWCWESEYEWGWAPFHYGRWIMSKGLGWIWIPGREWSGGWVNWQNSSTHYGWAPLPPEQSAYISISSTTDNGITWGFQFGLIPDYYIYEPCSRFHDYDRYYGHSYGYGHHDHDRKQEYEHRDYQSARETTHQPAKTTEPSRRSTIMQQVVSRSTPSTPSVARPIQQVVTRSAPSTSSATRSLQQIVSRATPSSSSSATPTRQAVTRPAPSTSSPARSIQQIVARSTPSSSSVGAPARQVVTRPAPSTQSAARPIQEATTRSTPSTSSPARSIQQIVARSTFSPSSATAPTRQVISQPRIATTQPSISRSTGTTSSSTDRRSSRVADIMSRSRR